MIYTFKLNKSCSCKGNYTNGYRVTHVDIKQYDKIIGRTYTIDIRYPDKQREVEKAKQSIREIDFYALNQQYTRNKLIDIAMTRDETLDFTSASNLIDKRIAKENESIKQALEPVLKELEVLI